MVLEVKKLRYPENYVAPLAAAKSLSGHSRASKLSRYWNNAGRHPEKQLFEPLCLFKYRVPGVCSR